MLFNSYKFIFLFLPLSLLVFHWIGRRGHHRIAIAWLVGISLFFYGWWNPSYLGLILFSILFNYGVGFSLGGAPNSSQKKLGVILGIIINLGLLVYYKYANFFVKNFNSLAGTEKTLHEIILPLAISFFTFQQIAYLIDVYRGETKEYNFLHYCLFVTFFPQLIAGPIVHHKEMLPQFMRGAVYCLRAKHLAVGFTIFVIGLFKKVILADGVAAYATPMFAAAESAVVLTFFEAWLGALAYSLQLYFDFSGYSDMAIGLARMFGIRLPLNFNSPYKATSIIGFWRRWHITLSRFLRDYLYTPLSGNRKGEIRRILSLMITMLLGGLWHGAGWTFVLWGGLHGLYLVINHSWRNLCRHRRRSKSEAFVGWIITMLAVIVTWVPFRAQTIDGAINILTTMVGGNKISLSPSLIGGIGSIEQWLLEHGVIFQGMFSNGIFESSPASGMIWILVLLIVSTVLPNTQQIMYRYRPAFEVYKGEISPLRYRWMEWRPTFPWVLFTTIAFTFAILELTKVSEFIYFQF
jgi:alginate O-acetyltransferase complex protein AlgI